MKMTSILQWFSCLLLLLALSECSDHFMPSVTPGSTAGRLRVKTLTLDLPNNITKVSSFSYDAQGHLGSIFTYQLPDSTISELEYSTFKYDTQNRVTELHHEAAFSPRKSRPNAVEQYYYTYNVAGQLTSINYVGGFLVNFNYNSASQLVSSNRGFVISGLSISGGESYTFTGNNLTALTSGATLPLRGPVGNTESVATYTHDGKINPFYGVYVIPAPYPKGFVSLANSARAVETYFGGVENELNLSQNNVLTKVAETTTTIQGVASKFTTTTAYQYEYNAANLPTLRTTFVNNTKTETLHFEYESY